MLVWRKGNINKNVSVLQYCVCALVKRQNLVNDGQCFIAVTGRVTSVESEGVEVLNANGVGHSEVRHGIHVLHQGHHRIVVLHRQSP